MVKNRMVNVGAGLFLAAAKIVKKCDSTYKNAILKVR